MYFKKLKCQLGGEDTAEKQYFSEICNLKKLVDNEELSYMIIKSNLNNNKHKYFLKRSVYNAQRSFYFQITNHYQIKSNPKPIQS